MKVGSSSRHSFLKKTIAQGGMCLAAVTSSIALQLLHLESFTTSTPTNSSQDRGPGLTADFGNAIGYRGLSASTLWLSFIQYYGDDARREVGYRYNIDYLESIVESEPRFTDAYFLVSSAVAYRASNPERAARLLERSFDAVDPSWYDDAFRLPHQLAGLNFLFIGNEQASHDYYYQAADWYEETHEESRQGWRDLADKIIDNPNSQRAQFNAWMQSYQVNPDPEIQDYILTKLDELGEVNVLPDGSVQIIPPPDL